MTTTRLTTQLASLAILLIATTVLYTSQGLTHTLVPLLLASGPSAGLVTSGYFLGFVIGAFFGATVIRRVGHIRAFAGLLSLVIFVILTMPLVDSLTFWTLARTIHGACIAATAIVVESWLVGASEATSRGRVLSVYTLAVYGGVGLGPMFLTAFPQAEWEMFSIGALLLCGAAVPVLFWRTNAPHVPDQPRAGLRRLLSVSPVSLLTAAVAGLGGGAFTALGPVYGLSLGLDAGGVGMLMSISVLAGLTLQWPVGHLSDRFERRRVVLCITTVCAIFAIGLSFSNGLSLWAIYVLLAGFQGTLYTLYPIALAHANDRVGPDIDATDIASGLLLAYGVGAACGPLLAAGAALGLGAIAGFVVAATALVVVALYVFWHVRRYSKVSIVDKGVYANVPQSTPAMFELEPRTVPDSAFTSIASTFKQKIGNDVAPPKMGKGSP